jgi:hypothetical protein
MPVRAERLPRSPAAPYESDFNEWCRETAALIRERRWSEIDAEHLAEEIEALANRDERELCNRLVVLVMHLLKWHIQAGRRSPSWAHTVREQRNKLRLILDQSPSLNRVARARWSYVYERARRNAISETGLAERHFPAECPWTPDQALDPDFYPEPAK